MRISNNESPELAGSHQPCSEQPDVFSTVIKITISSYSRFFNLYDGARSLISALCIAAVFLLPNTALLEGISVAETYAVGDCADPYNIARAIHAGNDFTRFNT